MWIIYQKKKKFTPQPNRVPWAHPVQCQPHERWTTLGVNSERTLMGQRLPETFPKGSQSVKKVANLLGPVCSNSFEDLIQWFPIRCNLPLRQYLAMCETLLVVTTWWMGGQDWHPVGRDQRCCPALHRAAPIPIVRSNTSTGPQWSNLDLV